MVTKIISKKYNVLLLFIYRCTLDAQMYFSIWISNIVYTATKLDEQSKDRN